MFNDIKQIIIKAIEELNESYSESLGLIADDNLVLMGKGSQIDSLDFVSLIVSIEDKIYSKYNKSLSITDERAFSNKYNPFGSIDKLASYIVSLLEE